MTKQIFKYLLPIALITLSGSVIAEVNTRLRVNVQDLKSSDSAIFPTDNATFIFSALDTTAEVKGFRIATTAHWFKRDGKSQFGLDISEAFYDFTFDDWYLSAGKKKLDWDVGYGFRPLDMFSPTDSLAIYTAIPPGAIMLVGDYFTESGNVSLICNETSPNYLESGENVSGSLGCGGRYYRYFAGFEAQLLGHYDNKLGFRVGGSALKVIGDSLSLHGSLLWQQNYRSPAFHTQALMQPDYNSVVTTQWEKGSVQGLLGSSYTFSTGINLIAEYWHDGRAPSNKQWRELIRASQAKVPSQQLMMMRSHFATQNLFRDNLMIHLRTSAGSWRPTLTLLANPNDSSMLVDGELCNSSLTSSQYCLGLRQYAGGSGAIYRQLGHERTWYFHMEIDL